MNSLEINEILRKNKHTKKNFVSVLPYDYIGSIKPPTRNNSYTSFVVNNQPSYMNGLHWVALFLTNTHIELFDPLSLPANFFYSELFNYLKSINSDIKTSPFPVQQFTSKTCGVHCINFIFLRSLNLTYSEIFSVFYSKNQINNDHIVLNYFT